MSNKRTVTDKYGNIGHWVTLPDGRKVFIKD